MTARRKLMKIALEKVSRTDLICIACGMFRTEWAIVPNSADPEDAVAGLHSKCIDAIHVRHTRKRESKDPGVSS